MFFFAQEERKEILHLVRSTIEARLEGTKSCSWHDLPAGLQEKLAGSGSCFVTLHGFDGNLRGCIGNIEPFEALGDNLQHNALNAAFNDPRFHPVMADEFAECSIEVSVLSPIRKIDSYKEFMTGRDGVIMRKDNRSAVFLPQVAPEQGWDEDETLHYLSLKAGLSKEAYLAPDAEFFTFSAEVFGEDEQQEMR